MGGITGVIGGGMSLLSGGGSLVGLMATNKKTPSHSMPTAVHGSITQALPETPAAPKQSDADGKTTENAQMEAERERERQAALLRKQQAPELFTSGLGAAGLATTSKKTLLGG